MANERTAEETDRKTEGIALRFPNSEALRAFILSPEKPGKTTLAERIAGIREIPLGEFDLDGQLFRSARFTLIVEPDRDQRGGRPTAIIRADLELENKSSKIGTFQTAKSQKADEEEVLEKDVAGSIQDTINAPLKFLSLELEPDSAVAWSSNAIRFGKLWRDKTAPLALLQIWDPDNGAGSISISLLSYMRYSLDWMERDKEKGIKKLNGLESEEDEADRWQFKNQVGIDVYDETTFGKSLAFFQSAFTTLINTIYQVENQPMPHLTLEIEPPLVFKDEEQITFAEIGGQKMAVLFLKGLADFEKRGRRPIDQALLLAGPAGNGKTKMTKALAGELGAPMVVKTTNDLPPEFTDADVINLLEAGFWEAKAAAKRGGGKAIYCLEQIEAFLGQLDEHGRLHDFLMNAIDQWVQDEAVILVLTSNNPEQLHEGIPSRCQKVDVPRLGREGLIETLQIWADKLVELTGHKDVFGDVDWGEIAFHTMLFSGRDIKHFLSKAFYLREIQSRLSGRWQPIDTDFLVAVARKRTPLQ